MKQHVRLRVIAPLVVVAVGGLAVWKFVLSEDASTPVASDVPPAVQPASVAPAAEAGAGAAGSPPAGARGGSPDDWVAAANAICEEADGEIAAIGEPASLRQALRSAPKELAIMQRTLRELQALEIPADTAPKFREMLFAWGASVTAGEEFVDAIAAKRYGKVGTLADKGERLADEGNAIAAELGAGSCAALGESESGAAADDEPIDVGALMVAQGLEEKRVAVVVVYAPGAELDGITLREARAGAANTKAAFVAVNGERELFVRGLATKLDFRRTPMVLVFKRGPRLMTQIEGFADRQTVAQAVVNARAPR
jgi:hypothetical protein